MIYGSFAAAVRLLTNFANLVLAGIKTATASTKLAYELDGETCRKSGHTV